MGRPVDVPIGGPPLRYFGSKWRLADWVIANLPSHRCYVEGFGGAAAVLLRKPPVPVEYYNDADGDLTCFFEVVRDRCEELVAYLLDTPLNQRIVEGERPADPLARAGWAFQRAWGSFVGGPRHASFNLKARDNPADLYRRRARQLEGVAERFRSVVITKLDALELLSRLDKPGVTFYLDPPYLGAEREYAVAFPRERHAELAEAIAGLEHARAAISYVDHPLVRQLYSDSAIFSRRVRTFAGGGAEKPFRHELLIVTRPPTEQAPGAIGRKAVL